MAVMDEEHPSLPQPPSDTNSYTLGRIGLHNIVITCLPAGQMGTTPAATVATHMQRTFEQIKVGLMVGIGGGVPSTCDIRLGDVVISKPNANANNGGIVQYDFGKHVKQNGYIRTGSLNAPPRLFLTALNKMQAKNHQILQVIEHEKSAVLRKLPEEYGYQGEENDQLFEADYEHGSEETCAKCDANRLVKRLPRGHRRTVIHYGTVASGNSVIKSGKTRDDLAKSHEVKCFEMEAAGINAFPYLVIRGICDYSDSHKNKRWQEHAALCAAICAKELLSLIAPEQDRVLSYQYQGDEQTLHKVSFPNRVSAAAENEGGGASIKAGAELESVEDDVLPQPSDVSTQKAIGAVERFIIGPSKSNEEPFSRKVYADRKVVDSINDWYNASDSRILRIAGTMETVYPSSTSLIPASLSKSSGVTDGSMIFVRCNGPKTSPARSLVSAIYSLISHLLNHCGEKVDLNAKCQELDGTIDTIGKSFSIISELLKSKPRLTILIDGIERIQGTPEVTRHVDKLIHIFQESFDIDENVLKILFTTAGPCRSFQEFRRDALVTVNVDMKKSGGKSVLGTYEIPLLR